MKEHERIPIDEAKSRTALEIIMNSQYAGYYLSLSSQTKKSMEDRLFYVLGGILQAGGITVIDDITDEEIPTGFSYGQKYLRMGSDILSYIDPELSPKFVTTYLGIKSKFPDAVINYRLNGVKRGLSIERPNPGYDPEKGADSFKNPRFRLETREFPGIGLG